jgi:NADPH2:quinone reductase
VNRPVPVDNRTIVVIGGAGGVGSIAIQIAKGVADMRVVATASRPETSDWVRKQGADFVLDHSRNLAAEMKGLDMGAPGFVFSTTETERHFDEIVEMIEVQGRLGVISGIGSSRADKLSGKSIALCYELMFTRPIYGTSDIAVQQHILSEVARLVDAGTLATTRTEHFGRITAENLRRAHAKVETGKAVGKIVLEGF